MVWYWEIHEYNSPHECKKDSYVFISIDTEKVFDKIQCSFQNSIK